MTTPLTHSVLLGAALVAAMAQAQGSIRPEAVSRPADSTSIQAQSGTSPALAAVLTRACGDCHSNSIVSRWYTRAPLFSTIMSRGASKGRKAVNFAAWTSYTPEQQAALLQASCTDAKTGKMPMSAYVRLRGEARLSAEDVETICAAAGQAARATATAQARKEP